MALPNIVASQLPGLVGTLSAVLLEPLVTL
jgi:hypothetical protein